MPISTNIKLLREFYGLSQAELGKIAGVSDKAVWTWEQGLKTPRMGAIQKMADHFGLQKSNIIEDDGLNGHLGNTAHGSSPNLSATIPPGFSPMPELEIVPRVGRIACGTPILAEENIEEYDSVPRSWGASMTLLCRGDSMAPSIQDGDLVAIRRQPEVENGEIAAVRLDDEATLKRVYLYPTYIELRPENPAYASIIKIGEEMNSVSIEGKVVGLCRAIY